MKKNLSLPTLCFLLFCCPNGVLLAQKPLNTKRLDSALVAMEKLQLLNGSVLWAENEKIIFKKAFGIADSTAKKKLTTHSSFNLASVSKQFVAMTIMMLSQEKKLRYDDPIEKYLPEITYPGITIRHLLTHTSGLPEYFDLAIEKMAKNDTLTNESMLQLFRQYKPALVFKPGERWEYCNTGYVMLASITERVSGVSFAEFIDKRIVKPLHLTNTYVFHFRMKKRLPTPNRVYGFERKGGKPVSFDLTPLDGVVGDGNMYSSVEDLFTWVKALETNQLVSKETMQEAYTPVRLNNGSTHNYGFGWGIEKDGKILSHTGSWVGFKNVIWRDLEHQHVFILLDNGEDPSARRTIQDLIKNIQEDKPIQLPKVQLITNVQLIDGSGTESMPASVRITGNRIKDLGSLQQLEGEEVIDGRGKVLAPGFIDTHSHHDWGMLQNRSVTAAISQGITTIVIGQDGGSQFPLKLYWKKLEETPVSVNVASYVGHNTVRDIVMGKDYKRHATQAEIDSMKVLVKQELEAGALGLATGLEYDPSIYSAESEPLALAAVAAQYKRRYISHIRSEDRYLERAFNEIINIGATYQMPVQISHTKMAIVSQWKNAPKFLAKLDSARAKGVNITADIYPYEHWQSTMSVLLPNRNFEDVAEAHFALTELTTPEGLSIMRCPTDSSYNGKTLAEVAKSRKETPEQTMLTLIKEAEKIDEGVRIIARSMHPDDIATILKWPYANVCSDGASGGGHPRGRGSFTRILSKYVRQDHVLTLPEAIRKMTSLSAQNMGIRDRGLVKSGFYADLVLFDPLTVTDKATFKEPNLISEGILKVWVNGQLVWNGNETKTYSGKILKAD